MRSEEVIPQVYYLRAIEAVYHRYGQRRLQHKTRQKGSSLAQIYADKTRFSRLIATTINNRHYVFSSSIHEKVIQGKTQRRIIRSSSLTDLLLQHALFLFLKDIQKTSSHVYTQPFKLIRGIAREIRTQCKQGGYSLFADIHRYTDSIPNYQSSPLWKILENNSLANIDESRKIPLKSIAFRCMHPGDNKKNKSTCKLYGLPTGNPITQFLGNEYLSVLDRQLSTIAGVKYYRYFDEFVIFTESYELFVKASTIIKTCLCSLKLKLNEKKSNSFYCGRNEANGLLKFKGVSMLGFNVSTDGQIGLDKKQVKKIIQKVRYVATAAKKVSVDQVFFVKTINESLLSTNKDNTTYNNLMLSACTNRTQLKEIDYYIARTCAEVFSGISGPRAFRQVSYKSLRDDGLVSLCVLQNKYLRDVYARA